MKSKVFILAAALMTAACASAQKGIDNGTPYGSGADSLECIKNISLFIPYAKSNNFKDALPFWEKVYGECPASTKNVYVYGVDIIGWQISQATDATQKNALIDKLIKLYDDRVKYFGNDKKYGKDWIVSRKAQTYNQLKGDETDPTVIYQWTKEVLDEFKEKTEPLAISLYMFASFKQMQGDKEKYKEQYVNDFLKCTAYLDQAIAAQSDEKEKENILARKTEIEQNFAGSGAADCETLQSIYASKVEANKDNLDFLKETMTLLRRVGCKETDVYMAASEYAYKQEPTAESAMGLGGKAFKAGDYAAAEKYYNEAIGMTEDTDIKADLYFALAAMAASQNQYSKAKSLSLKCLEAKPSYGRAYILIAQLYSQGGRAAFPDDPVKAKLVFIAACDKAERARQVDPSVADEAAKLIRTYREYFPTKQEVFMHPELNEGADFSIGGWIGERVKIRL